MMVIVWSKMFLNSWGTSTIRNVLNAMSGYKKWWAVTILTVSVDANFVISVATNSIETHAETKIFGRITCKCVRF